MRPIAAAACLWVCVTCLVSIRPGAAQQPVKTPFAGVLDEHPAIRYATEPTHDAMAQLRSALASGIASLTYDERGGYLRSVLSALDISGDSQVLVFSKTGIQRDATSPRNPRALYFNDHAVVGYIAGARYLEIAAHDPQQGVVFYTMDQFATGGASTPARVNGPDIARPTNCVVCHVSSNTLEVPGLIARSMITARDGDVMPQLGSYNVDHRTPLSQRWGGWFVTGHHDAPPHSGAQHLGNATTTVHAASGATATSNEVLIAWTNSDPAARGYLSAESDISTLMLFDHQMRAMNLVTRLNWETRVAANDGELTFTRGPLRQLVEEMVDYLLFVGEVAPPARLTPRRTFAQQFVARGPHDRRGRSLRQLELERRLLRYPCSYMVYSAAFASLPVAAREAVYQRMGDILGGRIGDAKYSHLSAADRTAIVEILRETKTDLPESFPVAARD